MKRKRHINLTFWLLGVAVLAALAGIVLIGLHEANANERPVVVVTVKPQQYLLQQIAGSRVQVVSLLEAGSNPEAFFNKGNELLSLNEHCVAYFTMGHLGYEEAISDKVRNMNPHIQVFDNSAGITLLADHPMSPDSINPHVWTSVRNARVIAANMLQALTKLQPKDRKYFKRHYDRLIAQLDTLDAQFSAQLQSLPPQQRRFVVRHPSLSYLARDYGLTQQVAAQGQALPRGGVLFVQAQFDGPNKAQVPATLHTVTINTMSYDWVEQLQLIVNSLATATKQD